MKLNEKINIFILVILYFSISYLLCSTNVIPTSSGNLSRRTNFCSTPYYILIIIALVFLIYN